jgi:hypothetical protein
MADIQPVDYERFVRMADRILARWGQVGTLQRPKTTGSGVNPIPAAPETTPALFAVLDFEADQIDGTRIKATDKQVYLAPARTVEGVLTPLGFTPATTDSLIEADGGAPLKIIGVETIKPASTVCLYVLQVRR